MLTTLRANAWKYTAITLALGLGFALLMQTLRLAQLSPRSTLPSLRLSGWAMNSPEKSRSTM